MDNYHHLNWFLKNQEEKQENIRKNDVRLVNTNLHRLIQKLSRYIDREKHKELIATYSQKLVYASILDISNATNYESVETALSQSLFIDELLFIEQDIPQRLYYLNENQRIMQQLTYENFETLLRFNDLKKN
jgi:hypothetical protein